MLLRIYKRFKDGRVVDEILEGKLPYSYTPEEGISSCGVQAFKYDIEHYIAPAIFTDTKGEKFIVPQWIKVHPATTLNDINWVKPEPKVKKEVFTAVSGSGLGEYKVKFDSVKNYWTCNCQGFYRLKNRMEGCKHIKSIKNKV
jgi:hypothetical protein